MPKAWIIEDLTADMPLSRAAALILRVKLPEVLHYQNAAVAGKIDGIHDTRVAAKRLREALRVLQPGLPKEARRKLLPPIEELNDALGEVRDRDVMRQAFKAMMAERPALQDLQPVRRKLARERRLHHRDLVKLLGELKRSSFDRRYEQLMGELEEQAPAGQPVVAQFAAEAIASRLQDVMDHFHDVTDRYDSRRFHRERIRVKKLKYAIEPFLPLLAAEGKALYAPVSDLQELMGLVHDVDVQGELIGDWVAAHGMTDGLRAVLRQIAGQRRALLRRARAHCRQMIDQDHEGRLQRLLEELT